MIYACRSLFTLILSTAVIFTLYSPAFSLDKKNTPEPNYLLSITADNNPDQLVFVTNHPLTVEQSFADCSLHLQFYNTKLHKFINHSDYNWRYKVSNFLDDIDKFQVTTPEPLMVDVIIHFMNPKIFKVIRPQESKLVVMMTNQTDSQKSDPQKQNQQAQQKTKKSKPPVHPSHKNQNNHSANILPKKSLTVIKESFPVNSQLLPDTQEIYIDKQVLQADQLANIEQLIDKKEPYQAIQHLQDFLKKNKKNPKALELLGDCYLLIEKPTNAAKQYQLALKQLSTTDTTKLAELYFKIGNSYKLNKKKPEALKYYLQSRQYNDASPSIYYNIGSLYLDMQNPTEAKTNLKKFIDLSHDEKQVQEVQQVLQMLEDNP